MISSEEDVESEQSFNVLSKGRVVEIPDPRYLHQKGRVAYEIATGARLIHVV
jgi:hypothetical protein